MSVKRYDLEYHSEWQEDADSTMEPMEDGDYVLYEDYQALAQAVITHYTSEDPHTSIEALQVAYKIAKGEL